MPVAPTPSSYSPPCLSGGRGADLPLIALTQPPTLLQTKFSAPHHRYLLGKVTLGLARSPELEVESASHLMSFLGE